MISDPARATDRIGEVVASGMRLWAKAQGEYVLGFIKSEQGIDAQHHS